MTVTREVAESPVEQGVSEIIVYTLTTTPWGSSPTSISCKVYDVASGGRTDVTTTVMPTNSPSATGDVIALSPLRTLTVDHVYRVEITFICSGNTFLAWFIVSAKY